MKKRQVVNGGLVTNVYTESDDEICEGCGLEISFEDASFDYEENRPYCERCHFTCEHCMCVYPNSDKHSDDYGCYCPDCYDELAADPKYPAEYE